MRDLGASGAGSENGRSGREGPDITVHQNDIHQHLVILGRDRRPHLCERMRVFPLDGGHTGEKDPGECNHRPCEASGSKHWHDVAGKRIELGGWMLVAGAQGRA